MAKFALFDGDGRPIAFFDSVVHRGAIPAEVVAITDEQWREFVEHQGWRRWTGSAVETIPGEPAE